MSKYVIRESGRNGSVEVSPKMVERTLKRTFGKDDIELIPISQITYVKHDRKTMGSDKVILQTQVNSFEWKIKKSKKALQMVEEIKQFMSV